MRRLMMLLCLLGLLAPAIPVQPSAAQASDADAAAQMAYQLSVLEADGNFNALYDLIHPDAHDIIPRSAVIGWYQNEFVPMGVAPATITGVQFAPWTWPVNGVTYPYTAEVSFEQARADGTYIVDVVRLVQDSYGTWRWFFGRSQEFVAEQIERYAQPVQPVDQFASYVDYVIADIETYWMTSFAGGNERYMTPSIRAINGIDQSACGLLDATASPGYYCGLDQTIYVNMAYFAHYHTTIGNYAWITILAHEWGHHIQFLDQTPAQTSKENELRADCLAGAYARDAETRGLVGDGDILEAIVIAAEGGDAYGLPDDLPGAHGSSDERVTQFMQGYLTGLVGCGLDLSDGSGPSLIAPPPAAPGLLLDLLPGLGDVPADLSLMGQNQRTLAEVAANYIDPAATEQMYRDWGWEGNVTVLYAGPGTQSGVTEVYVSIHQLGGRRDAQDALAVSVSDQAASTGAWEIGAGSSADETRALRTNADMTLYAREGDYLIRLTVTSWLDDPAPVAVDILEAILSDID